MPDRVPSFQLYGEKSGESADFWIHCETLPARSKLHDWEIAPHRHDAFFQIFTLTAGHGLLHAGSESIELTAPCIVFIPQGAVHGFSFSRDVDGLVVTALGDRLKTVASIDHRITEFARRIHVLPLDDDGDVDGRFAVACIERIAHELTHAGAARMVMLDHIVPTVIVSLARASGATSTDHGGMPVRDRNRLETLEALIGAHYRQRRDIDFYARRVGISRTHLNRIARRARGQNVQGLIVARLMEAAKRDLIFSPSPVQAIAYSFGFADPAYFNRFFRRQTGMTPGAFRNRERSRLAGRQGVAGIHPSGDTMTRTGSPSSQD